MEKIVDWFGAQGCHAFNAIGLLDVWGCSSIQRQVGWGILITIAVFALFAFLRGVFKSVG